MKERGISGGETEKRNFSVDNHLHKAMPDVGDSMVLAPGQTGQWTDKQLEAFGKCLLWAKASIWVSDYTEVDVTFTVTSLAGTAVSTQEMKELRQYI